MSKFKLPPQAPDWLERSAAEARGKIADSPLMQGCAAENSDERRYARALLGGFWHFVDVFPGIIRETYTAVPALEADERLRRFLMRAARRVAGKLQGMETDERSHRELWIASARQVGLSERQLHAWPVLPEIRHLADQMAAERDLGRRLLYFVAVEIVAAEVSQFLSRAPRFVESMGANGMLWFAAHPVDRQNPATHEAIAYGLALSFKRVTAGPLDEASVHADIQRCVDWFFAGSVACARAFSEAGGGR
ncbi:hypothetical protein [Azoarcus sp. DN11]|uniref:hypothetical protein n=1 Tax=Azoarcus sp. DN11 TaxID=356837 RepID=UPI000EAF54DA|nr:hypothetical protein [Azoarcus sp. DN11]AYH45607.1 hypothetical protein CDA09_19855 [Azoarcus sp. DN11]